jgi:hypothetical protein
MFFWPWHKHTHTNYFISYDPPCSRGNKWRSLLFQIYPMTVKMMGQFICWFRRCAIPPVHYVKRLDWEKKKSSEEKSICICSLVTFYTTWFQFCEGCQTTNQLLVKDETCFRYNLISLYCKTTGIFISQNMERWRNH